MAIEDFLRQQGARWLQDKRVKQLMKDPRVMDAFMRAVQARGRLQERIDRQTEQLARALNLATKTELREMKRALRKMELELQRAKQGPG